MNFYIKVGSKYLNGFEASNKRTGTNGHSTLSYIPTSRPVLSDSPGEMFSNATVPGNIAVLIEQMRYNDIPREQITIEVARS